MNMELSIHELVFVHLASRLFLRSLDKGNPGASSCLAKLSSLFEQFSPDISSILTQTASALGKKSGVPGGKCEKALQDLTTAWILQRKIKITHYSQRRKAETDYMYHPYWLEPGSGKTSVYAIGYSEEENQYRTLKIDRITHTELTKQTFCVREDFNIESYLGKAWGVWKSDKAPVNVVLRFDPGVTERVLENSWHETETTEALPDGSLLWKAAVSQPLEMFPWIRGWGSDVEVKEPAWMRDAIREEIGRMRKIYEGEN
jgi:predicted DNA-binding transcriptional regulator YafY